MGRSDVEGGGHTFVPLFAFLEARARRSAYDEIFWFAVHGVRETFVDRSCITLVAEGSRLTWAVGGKKRSEILCMPWVLGSITSQRYVRWT